MGLLWAEVQESPLEEVACEPRPGLYRPGRQQAPGGHDLPQTLMVVSRGACLEASLGSWGALLSTNTVLGPAVPCADLA